MIIKPMKVSIIKQIHDVLGYHYDIIDSLPKLKNLAKKMNLLEEFAYDTETNTLRVYGPNKNFKCVGISISWGKYNNYYIPLHHIPNQDRNISEEDVLKYLKPIFEKTDIRIIGWNLKFDCHVLARLGINIRTKDLFDCMLASWLCDENTPNGLKDNTKEILGYEQEHIKTVFDSVPKELKAQYGFKGNKTPTFDLSDLEVAGPYALDDGYCTWTLYNHFLDLLEKEGMEKIFYGQYTKFLITLFNMEERGVTVDVSKLEQMQKECAKDLEELEYDMLYLAGCEVNMGSNQQLAELLFGYADSKNPNKHILDVSFNFPVVSTTAKGMPQANADVLEKLAKKEYKDKRKVEGIKLVNMLLNYKKLQKLKSAFMDGLLEQMYDDGKVHPSFNQIGTTSGRISCSAPNLMQMPNSEEDDKYQIRDVFIGSVDEFTNTRNHIISVDYSNLEVRVIAHFSQDEALISAFNAGKDLHGNTAKMMFRLDCDANEVKKLHPQLRQQGKVIAFLNLA